MRDAAVVADLDPAEIRRVVGRPAYAEGARYALAGAVLAAEWDGYDHVLVGSVRGSGPDPHRAEAFFSAYGGEGLSFDSGACTCAVGRNCKHVAALALTATGVVPGREAPGDDGWQDALRSLLDPDASTAPAPSTPTLAVELTLAGDRASPFRAAPPSLLARLMRPGKSGWIYGGLTWNALTTERADEFGRAQVDALRDLFVLHQRSVPSPGSAELTRIDLLRFESRQLWALLDEIAGLDVPLVGGHQQVGTFGPYDRADLVLDVADDPLTGGLEIASVLQVEGVSEETVVVGFVGGDGVVYVPAPDAHGWLSSQRARFARLTRPVPSSVRRLAIEGGPLRVPAEGRRRFRDEFTPRLRGRTTIASSDGSWEPPAVVGPTLVLRAGYGGEHEVALRWEWAYEIGASRLRAPLAPPGLHDGYRDTAAERAVVDGLGVPLDRYGLHLDRPVPDAPTVLGGLATMRFTTEVLPLLRDAPDVTVEVVGDPADYRELGDAVRVGLATTAVDGDTDWFDLGVTVTVDDHEVPLAPLLVALASDDAYLLLSDGAFLVLDEPELQALRRLLEEARALQDAPGGPLRVSRFQAGLWQELTDVGVVERQAQAWHDQVGGLLALDRLDHLDDAEVPATLRGQLRPYQVEGLAWLAFLWRFGLGGVLADDMGLGKTVQTLALICRAREHDPAGAPFLIVAPTSVVPNWVAEAGRFAPHLRTVAVTDTRRDLAGVVAGADVVVTSYALFRLASDAYERVTWAGLILDEAQAVKNHRSKVHRCARRLPAPFKLAITGTPMENNLMELWSLLAITAPGLFPSARRFREHYARPIESEADAGRLAQLRRRVRPLMKRRTKELVAADLPPKQEQVVEVELGPEHRTIYERHLQRERQKILGLIDDLEENRFLILKSLTLLRRLALHAGFVDPEHDDVPSSKIDTLVEQLDGVISAGRRALVFSQFTGYLTRVRARLDEVGVEYCYLDGSTRDRGAVVRRFKDGTAPVFLISLKAGGSGLNLAEADYCFLLDPWWNPATEAQAVDRTHRIGQTRAVFVYRLVARDTIEEKVMALSRRKAVLTSGVLDAGDAFGSAFDADDIRALLE